MGFGKRVILHTRWLMLATLVLLTSCSDTTDQTQRFDHYLSQSEKSIANGDINTAIIELKNALQLNGEHLGARSLLASLYLEKGEFSNAEKEFRFVRGNGGAPDQYLVGLGDALLRLNQWQQVLDTADPVKARSLPPEDQARIQAQRGSAYIGLEQLNTARDAFEKALSLHEHSIPAWLGQAALAVGEGRRATARSLIRQALPEAAGSDLVEAWRLTAELDRLDKNFDAAEAAYTKALELDTSDSLSIRMSRIHLRIEVGNFAGAHQDLADIPGRYLKHPHVLYAQGLLAMREQRLAAASEYLRELRNADPNHIFGLYYLGMAHLAMDKPEEAETYFVQAAALAPRSTQIALMLGQTRYALGKHSSAARILEPLLAFIPDDPRLQSLLGSVYLAQGKTSLGQQMLERSVLQQPDSSHERMKLGLSLMELGEHDHAIAELERAVSQSDHSPQTQTALVMAYIRAGQHDAARRVVTSMQEAQPDASHWNLLGLIETAAGDMDAGKNAFGKALELRPDLTSARYNLAQHYLRTGDLQAARQEFSFLLKHSPDHFPTLMAMTQLEERTGNREAALRHATQAMERHPDQLAPRLWLARDHLAMGKADDSLALLQAIQEYHSENPGFLGVLGEAQLLAGKTSDAVGTFRELTRIVPGQAIGHYMLARACAMDRAYECLRESLVSGLSLDDSYPGLVELVHHAISLNNEPSSVGKLLWRLQHAAPDNLVLIRLRTQFALRHQRFGEAMSILEGALEHFPDEWSLHEMSARAHMQNRDPATALALVRGWQQKHPDDIDAMLLAGMIQAESNDHEQAIRAFEKVLAASPDHPQALNNLAWLLRHQDLARAEAYAERANELAPGYVTRDTLGVILFLKGDHERAEGLLRSAFGEQPNSRSIRHHLAQVLAERQLKGEARALLDEVLRDGESFEGRDEAEQLLKKLGG